jgi:nicotinate phosphoribosyltransferase
MTDFVSRVLRPEQNDWIVRSLMDLDFYKFAMGYFIFTKHRGIRVRFELINRHAHIPLARIIDEEELRRQLDHVRTLMFSRTDLSYLRGMDVYGANMFSEDYLSFLAGLSLPTYELTRVGDQYALAFECDWEDVIWWETLGLAIITELFYRKLMETMSETELRVLYARATDKLYRKLRTLKEASIRFACFAQRRRHSFLWQRFAIETAREVMGDLFVGTSNTWMAFNQDLTPIGTNAHELPMVLTAIAPDEKKRMAQYTVLTEWGESFPNQGLRVFLPDTYGSAQFFAGMPQELAESVAHDWRGMRQDSGDVFAEAQRYEHFLRTQGMQNTRERLFIPSDGLDVPLMLEIKERLGATFTLSDGWGTKFANDFEGCHPRGDEYAVVNGQQLPLTNDELFRGHSIVCKVTSANGNPAVKLSNNTGKATGPRDEVTKYLRIFGHEGHVAQAVEV